MKLFYKRDTFVLFAALLALAVLTLLHSELNPALKYTRVGLQQGQLWRLFSAHIVHLNLHHGLMNGAGLLVTMLLVGRLFSITFWCLMGALISLGISLALYMFSPDVLWYVGFSGTLHGLLVLGLLSSFIAGDKLHGLALLVVFGKVIREQLPDFDIHHLQEAISAAVVVDAHLYGALLGVGIALVYYAIKRLKSRSKNAESKIS
ncbi:MAG: rhomboid family GlyGly-CTERM serine protease [Lentisphaeria bacterium]|jgi:rhomboid family GlyGly-CTERM serine protease